MTPSPSNCVVDASTVIAVLKRETGHERAAAVTQGSVISAVNFAEVGTHLTKAGVSLDDVRTTLASFEFDLVDFDEAQALETARLRPLTLRQGLSLGDRACLALAALRGLPAVTTDRNWSRVDIGVAITVIR